MTKKNNFSQIIQTLMMNEINVVISKYSNIETKKLEYVEALLSKIDDEKLKQELLQDIDKILELSTEIENKNVDNNIIQAYLWIKNNSDLEISIENVIKVFEDIEGIGYGSINDNTIIYKKIEGLEKFEKEKLEYMLEDESYVDKLFNKDTLIDMWINGKTKEEIIKELIIEVDTDELFGMKSEFVFCKVKV